MGSPQNQEHETKVVIGGWLIPQRKIVIEDRLRQLTQLAGIEPRDFYAPRRGVIGFIVCQDSAQVFQIICRMTELRPTTPTPSDDNPVWIKRGMPLAERERTKPIRCLGGAVYAYFEAQPAGKPPDDFTIDHRRNEVAVKDDAVAWATGIRFYFNEEKWAAALPDVPLVHTREQSERYVKGFD